DRPDGETTTTPGLVAGAHHRDGNLVHPPTHGVLRGQRSAPAPVALAAPFGTLAPSQPRWVPDSGLGAATPSARSAYARSSLGLSLAQRTPTCRSWPWTRWRSGSEAARSTSPCWHSCCSMFPRDISRTPVVRGRLALQAASGPESQYPAIQG